MIKIHNALCYPNFVYIDNITIKDKDKNVFNGSICIIDNTTYQLRMQNNTIYFEKITTQELSAKHTNKRSIGNRIKLGDKIGLIVGGSAKLIHYEYQIPLEVSDKIIVGTIE